MPAKRKKRACSANQRPVRGGRVVRKGGKLGRRATQPGVKKGKTTARR